MKIGFIGTGNMGSAMIKGIVTSEAVSGNDIWKNPWNFLKNIT